MAQKPNDERERWEPAAAEPPPTRDVNRDNGV